MIREDLCGCVQVAHDYFENAMAFFTDTIYNAIMAGPPKPSTCNPQLP
jgi:hypothetical protein